MNRQNWSGLATLAIILILNLHPAAVFGQGTAFTYQGRLNEGGVPVNGRYDFQFTLYDTNVAGTVVAGPITNSATSVSNGLFTTTLEFGPGVFTGQPLWLDISVSSAGSNTFTELTPRQPLASTPYAVQAANANVAATASSVAAANINGTIATTQLPSTVLTNGANITGTFSGNGASITGIGLQSLNSNGAITWTTNWGRFTIASAPSADGSPIAVTAADINGDGKVDLISANKDAASLTVWTNDGSGGFVHASTLNVGNTPTSVVATDVNGDGHLDLICANADDNTLTVLTNDGSGGFATASTLPVGGIPDSLATADVNGDLHPDLICANYGSNTVSVLTNNGVGGFALASTIHVGNGPVRVITANANVDGYLDIICLNGADQTLSVLTNNGAGGFALASSATVGTEPSCITAADVNNDGYVDLICANYGASTLSVLTNDSTGRFVLASTLDVDASPQTVTTADVNDDGKVDIISANAGAGSLTILTNNGSGGFAMAQSVFSGSGCCSVVAADVNDDGQVDLISANFFDQDLTVLTNTASFSPGFAGDGSNLSWATTTYTPTIGNGSRNFTTSVAQGDYSQLGNITFVEIRLVWTDKNSAAANSPLLVSLPYGIGSQRAMFTLGFANGITFTNQLAANANLGSANINLWNLIPGKGPYGLLITNCAASGEIQISGFFRH